MFIYICMCISLNVLYYDDLPRICKTKKFCSVIIITNSEIIYAALLSFEVIYEQNNLKCKVDLW
jgi:hypothetical protein